ncbi:MAG TPA: phytoene/squalene synthase family protein [Salinivirgaceae bacterium]|nr:phytoene/squalene synthase family protein [Salinivirgaceae bacterium]
MKEQFYFENCYSISEIITKKYSTSFSSATGLLDRKKRRAIYAIYGFVRLADEIVDSFHSYDKAVLLENFERELSYALEHGISTNPLLAAFSRTVREYNIDPKHIEAFMQSMRFDLFKTKYEQQQDFHRYVYGSAEVVGLMCLKVFCNGNNELYNQLELPAKKLGSAFQKVNFLRDLKEDHQMGRTYFPEMVASAGLNNQSRKEIEESIETDFVEALPGIRQLPGRSKLAVALAYFYYRTLFKKIKRTRSQEVLSKRIRINNLHKSLIFLKVSILYRAEFKL